MKKFFGEYRFGFDAWGLLLFAFVMLPNILWFCIPAPNDVLRGESGTDALDTAATVFQAVAVALLVFAVRGGGKPRFVSPFTAGTFAFLSCYYAVWTAYYCGAGNTAVLLILAAAPCLSLMSFELERKNLPALFPTTVFAVLHLVSSCVNFL